VRKKEEPMSIPVLVLLGFALWTLIVLFGGVGVYRWARILTGRASIREWRADVPQGCDWYQRAMRAHMNCVENLPVYGAIVLAGLATGVSGRDLDGLALTLLAARIGQSLVHIGAKQTESAAVLRFTLFFLQVVCIAAMAVLIAVRA
jgi:uncharacterized MAPEG superfamily protein